jgi:adenylate cyclase
MEANDQEIERKYLLRALPAGIEQHPFAEIDQGYIPGVNVRERVRRILEDGRVSYVRTIKVGTGMVKYEFEEPASEAFFTAVWPLTEGHRIRKRRYRVPLNGLVWEVDEFLDRENFFLAEVELRSADQIAEPPTDIAAVIEREVTNESGFSNYRLSK